VETGQTHDFSGTRTNLSSNRCGAINDRVFLGTLPSGSPRSAVVGAMDGSIHATLSPTSYPIVGPKLEAVG
jgi:hypothetical protein